MELEGNLVRRSDDQDVKGDAQLWVDHVHSHVLAAQPGGGGVVGLEAAGPFEDLEEALAAYLGFAMIEQRLKGF